MSEVTELPDGQVQVVGVVVVEDVAGATKSAQQTVTLHTDDRVWLLRSVDGPRIGVDDTLAAFAGEQVVVTGYPGVGALLATAVEVVKST